MQGVCGLESSTGLEPIPQQQEGHDEGCSIDEDHAPAKGVAGKGRHDDRHAPKVRRAGAERNKHVHVGRATAQSGVCPSMKTRTGPCPDDASSINAMR